MSTTLKIFGLPRTCTNLVTILIQTNFKVELLINNPTWKHGPNHYSKLNTEKLRNLEYVICTKNPYSWVHSLNEFQARHGMKMPIDTFVKGHKMMHYPDKNPIEIYNIMNKHWFCMNRPLMQIKSEDLITEKGQLKVLNKIRKKWNLELKLENFRTIPETVPPGAKNWQSQPEFVPKKTVFSESIMNYFRRYLDPETMQLCNYQIK